MATAARTRCPKLTSPGGVPERSKGTRCKRVGSAFAGSNPAPAMPLRAKQGAVGARLGHRFVHGRADVDGSDGLVHDNLQVER
jgi:hypothetical protein